MGRTGRRVSRSLIGILLVTLALLLVSYLKHTGTTQAEESPAPAIPAPAQVALANPEKPAAPLREPAATTPEIFTSVTPTPTTQPQLALAPETSSAPTAKPTESAAPAVQNTNTLADAQSKKDAGDILAA